MRGAPLKRDCVICAAPDDVRISLNSVIWPGDGIVRGVGYLRRAVELAQGSGVAELARLNEKTVLRHAEHIEASWREIRPSDGWRDGEVPLTHSFTDVMDAGSRLGMTALDHLQRLLETSGDVLAVLNTKVVVDIAKLGVGAAEKKETARLKGRNQAIEVMAIFGMGAGFFEPPGADEEATELVQLVEEFEAERKLLAERASA